MFDIIEHFERLCHLLVVPRSSPARTSQDGAFPGQYPTLRSIIRLGVAHVPGIGRFLAGYFSKWTEALSPVFTFGHTQRTWLGILSWQGITNEGHPGAIGEASRSNR